jgi:uncharacterized repeat protein (TIGR01451 family)
MSRNLGMPTQPLTRRQVQFHRSVAQKMFLMLLLTVMGMIPLWLGTKGVQSAPASVVSPPLAPLALCAKPRAKIDLVLPPADFVPTHSANALIGSNFQFEVAFDNNQGTNTGFAPYLNVNFPASGIDGAAGGSPYDGIFFDTVLGATYLGFPVTATPYIFPSTGSLVHPFTGQVITGAAGDQLVVIELPFGSYTPQQPAAGVIVNAKLSNLADLNMPLTINVQAGFRYGCSATGGGWVSSIPADNDSGVITPVLFTIDKACDAPVIGPKMSETATGPNFPHHYTIAVNVAPGQIVTNLKVTDLLPNNLAYKSLTSVSPTNGAPFGPLPPVGVAANNNLLTILFPAVTGTGGTPTQPDVKVVFEFFIPDKDATGAWILDPNTGAPAISENEALVEGNWTPLDIRDLAGPQTLDPPGPEYTLVCKSIAMQKNVSNTTKGNVDVAATLPPTDNSPGDILLNTLTFQVSDYFTFNQLTVEDIVSDGQFFLMFPAGNYPKFTITDQLHNIPLAPFTFGNPSVTPLPCVAFTSGHTRALFTLPGSMTGGWALTNPSPVPATGKINFITRIQEDYLCAVPSTDVSIDQNDKLFDRATINGTILNNSTLQPIATMQDDAAVEFKLLVGFLSKSVFAHTNRTGVQTLNPPATQLFAPGDLITFRLSYKLRHGDIEKFSIEDFLPLPVLKNATMATTPLPSCGGNIPAVDTACFQSGSLNLSGRPVVTKPPVNSLKFDYSSFDDPASPTGKLIDVLLTLEIKNDPFVDGLFLTNQLLSSENNSFNETTNEVTIAQFKVAEPNVRIRKGAVWTDNSNGVFLPAATPTYNNGSSNNGFSVPITSTVLSSPTAIHSDLVNVDAGDSVTFAVVAENIGSSPYGAFDVRISDTLPVGFTTPSAISVTDGYGIPLFYTGTTASFFTPAGIELTDPSLLAGALQAHSLTNGKNIAIVTYTAKIKAQVTPCQALANTATLANYSSTETGPNYAPPNSTLGGPYTDTRTVTIAKPQISKAFIGTNQPYTSGTNVTIGEEVTYEITVTLPEGTMPSLTVTDPLPAGLQAIWVGPITGPVVLPAPAITPTVFPGGCGIPVTLIFGTVNVPADNVTTNNWFKFQIRARVCNVLTNVGYGTGQTALNNSASVNTGSCSSSSTPVPVTVVEPHLTIAKQFTPNLVLPNGTVQINLVVTNSGTSPAYDVVVEDPLPNAAFFGIAQVTTPAGWLFSTPVSGAVATYTAQPATAILPSGTVTFVFLAKVSNGCGTFTNTATIKHATTLFMQYLWERDEPPTSGSAPLLIKGNPCPCGVMPPPNMVDWWTFDETAGLIANDISSLNNVGAYGLGGSAPAPSPGVVNNGLCFDGVNDYVEVPDHPEVNFTGACIPGTLTESFTIDVWVKTTANSGLQMILDKRANPGPVGYHLFLSNGRVGFQMNGLNFIEPVTGPTVADGNWHFIAVTVVRCSGAIGKLYVDGSQVHTFTPPAGSLVNTAKLQIGRRDPAFGNLYLKACIDELEIFKRALSATELQGIFAAGPSGKCKCSLQSKEIITCNPNGTFSYTFNLTNLTTFTVTGVNFASSSAVTITPSVMPISLPPGGSTTVTVTISGPGAVAGSTVCFFVGLVGPPPAHDCRSEHCITLPTCPMACAPRPPGMVGWWPMNMQNGAVNDVAPPPDSLVNNVGYSPAFQPVFGNVGGASGALFFGAPRVGVATQAELDFGTGDFSIDAWVRIVTAGPTQISPIVDKLNVPVGPGFAFYVKNQRLELNVNETTFVSTAPQMLFANPVANTGPWYLVAATVQRNPAQVSFYINGNPAGTFTGVPTTSVNNGLPMWIGGTRLNPGMVTGGIAIDELELFKSVVIQGQFQSIFHAGPVGKCP